jgi:hypothetical protein
MKERNPELLLEAANRLAQRRGGDAERWAAARTKLPRSTMVAKALRDSKVGPRIV